MKVSLNWLGELVELPGSVEALVDLLTLAGVEVEGIETSGVSIANVVVARIHESLQHPNADRLSVCQIDDGSGALRQIVCGAKNYKVGDKVPVALPGAVLPGDFKIKVGKLRGVESQGMLCSTDELGLPKGEDGLLILPQESVPGTPLGELYPGDTILDLEITPNRPDLLSVNGIAREIGALTNKAVKLVGPRSVSAIESSGTVVVEDETLCPLYTARVIRSVQVAPSPAWLCQKLESVGLRPINNIVDVTNLVMLELGQPLHAFDADKLQGSIQVRAAREGENFAALDSKSYVLGPQHLVIADAQAAVAIAGIMGGQATGVGANTVNIVLESAYFEPKSIRRSSRQLGLSSDSSYRFERGVDQAGVRAASQRAFELILELAGGQPGETLTGGAALDKGSVPLSESADKGSVPLRALDKGSVPLSESADKGSVPLRAERLARLLGIEVPAERVAQILTGFGLTAVGDGWQAPTFRRDLTREVDLIEEVARVIGMDAIPARTQARFAPASITDARYDRAMQLRTACAGQGLHEARSLTLVPETPAGVAYTQFVAANLQRVKNPMIDDQVVLRPNLLHGLLKAIGHNVRAGAKSVRLFEIGRVFSTRRPEESSHLAIVCSGPVAERSWRAGEGAAMDLFDFKGLVSAVLTSLPGGGEITFEANENSALALSLVVKVAGSAIGFAGQLWPADERQLDANAPVMFAEIDLDLLEKATRAGGNKRYREIPRFPSVTRDIALLAPLELTHGRIESVLKAGNEPLLAGAELFDVFIDPSGVKLPADRKSLAYSLTYRSSERTLTADEVNAAHARLKDRLKAELGVVFRE